MKEKKVTLLLLLVVLIAAGILGVIYLFTQRAQYTNGADGVSDMVKNEPYLELSLDSVPMQVDSICQELKFVVNVKNIGGETLRISDITDSKYKFVIMEKSGFLMLLYSNKLKWSEPTLLVTGLNELKPGESTKIALIANEEVTIDEDSKKIRNGFASLFQKGNGQAELELSFQKIEDDYTVVIHSNKLDFSIDIQAFESNKTEIGYLNKVCD